MADTPEPPVLDLDTLITRPHLTIDGARFDILSAEELSVIDSHRFGSWGRRIEELAKDSSEAAEAELDSLVARVARKVLVDVPDAVFAKLSGSHKLAIVDVFTGLLLRNRLGVAGAMARAIGGETGAAIAALLTGVTPLPGSSDSTAVTPRGGLWPRLRRWCGLT